MQFLDKVFYMPVGVLMSGVMVQTVQKTVWRFHRCCSSSRSSTSLSFCRGRSPWSRLFSRPQRFLRCRSFQVVDAPVVRFHRLFISVYSALLGSTVDTQFCVSLRRISVFSYVERWITDPEVDSRLSRVSASHLFVAFA